MSTNKKELFFSIFQGSMEELIELLVTQAQILQNQTKKRPFIFTIDGRAASGKTTLSRHLYQALQEKNLGKVVLIHGDDFFLRPEQRTPKRLATPGENIDYERLQREVLDPALHHDILYYQPFDCSTFSLKEPILIAPPDWIILEGSYTLNSHLAPYSDLSCFLSCDFNHQKERILKRSTLEKLKDFETRWIPLEEHYIEICHPEKKSNMIIDTTSWI